MTAFDPDWYVKPGVILQELLDYAGLTGELGVTMVAKLSGLTVDQVRGILSGKTRITKKIAQQLACGTAPLQISAQFWLNLEDQYRKGKAANKHDMSEE